MKIQRYLLPQIKDYLILGKVLVLYGPRQVGKTTPHQQKAGCQSESHKPSDCPGGFAGDSFAGYGSRSS
jgi:hypothetical protein